jgi:hypothetical protein
MLIVITHDDRVMIKHSHTLLGLGWRVLKLLLNTAPLAPCLWSAVVRAMLVVSGQNGASETVKLLTVEQTPTRHGTIWSLRYSRSSSVPKAASAIF